MGRSEFIIYGRIIEVVETKIIELPPDEHQASEMSYFQALCDLGTEKDEDSETSDDSN